MFCFSVAHGSPMSFPVFSIARLIDAHAEWDRQHRMLGLTETGSHSWPVGVGARLPPKCQGKFEREVESRRD
jgi:hypothetical protein